MDAADGIRGAGCPRDSPGQRVTIARQNGRGRPFDAQRVWEILGEWQDVELRIARGFAECRGLSKEQLEDIYQSTALALYRRPYVGEEHLRNALRDGIKKRALRLHRDERRRTQILNHNAPGLRLLAEAQEGRRAPEPAVIADEDRLVAREFLTELTEQERRVFGWLVEGLQYRAISTALEMPVNDARNLARACNRKRERFQLLHDTGRLCGYRAQTIQALQNGESTSEELAERAFAHLERCVHCRLEHKTNAKRLRRSFRDQAAALLPPVLLGHLGWPTRLAVRARLLLHRAGIDTTPVAGSGARERALAMLAGAGVGAKVAVGVISVGVLAGGAVATHVLEHGAAVRHHPASSASVAPPPVAPAPAPLGRLSAAASGTSARSSADTSGRPRQPRRSVRDAPSAALRPAQAGAIQREPGGFAYLGVPTTASVPAQSAHLAAISEGQHGGGPFSP